jgi:putative ABC transport system substrate-binding protein
LQAVEAAGEKLGVALVVVPARTVEDFDAALTTMTRERAGGFLAVASPFTHIQRAPLAALALQHQLPGAFDFKEYVELGGLMSYGPKLRCRASEFLASKAVRQRSGPRNDRQRKTRSRLEAA